MIFVTAIAPQTFITFSMHMKHKLLAIAMLFIPFKHKMDQRTQTTISILPLFDIHVHVFGGYLVGEVQRDV